MSGTMIVGERNTRAYQLLVWKQAIKLELKGMVMSSRFSVSMVAGKALGLPLRTRKQKVLDALEEHIQDVIDGKCDPCTMKGEE